MAHNLFFEIDGVDIANLIAYKGIKYTRNDIDSANAGRNLAGTMNRGRVVSKTKIEIKCIPMTESQTRSILNLIFPEYVLVHYIDPREGERTAQFYSNNVPATVCVEDTDGTILFDEISFPLVER